MKTFKKFIPSVTALLFICLIASTEIYPLSYTANIAEVSESNSEDSTLPLADDEDELVSRK